MLKQISLLILFAGVICSISAKNIEFTDPTCQTARAELLELAERVTEQIGYQGDYELCEPAQLYVLTNPWNRMMYSKINPGTGNQLLLINFDWFGQLNSAVQTYLMAVTFIGCQLQQNKFSLLKIWGYLYFALSLLVLFLIFLGLRKTRLRSLNIVLRIILTFLICAGLEAIILDRMSAKVSKYLGFRQTVQAYKLALNILQDRQAATDALNHLDATIKAGIENGHTLYKEHEQTYAQILKAL